MECAPGTYRLFEFAFFTLFGGPLFIFGITGNIISFIVLNKSVSKSSFTLLLQSLAVFDTLFLGFVILTFSIKPAMHQAGMEAAYEAADAYLLFYFIPCNYIMRFAIVWNTVLIAFHRFIAVCKPLHAASLCTVSRARRQLVVLIIVSVLYNLVKYGEFTVKQGPSGTYNRTVTYIDPSGLGKDRWYKLIYRNIIYMLVYYVVPLLILCVINVRLIWTLKVAATERAEMSNVKEAREKGLTIMLIVIITVFLVCQTPPMINQFLHNFLTYNYWDSCGSVQYYVEDVCNMLVFINSAVNIVIYTLLNQQFRHRLFNILRITSHDDNKFMTDTDGASP